MELTPINSRSEEPNRATSSESNEIMPNPTTTENRDQNGRPEDCKKQLLELGKATILGQITRKKYLKNAKSLIDKLQDGEDTDCVDEDTGETPLHHATKIGKIEIVKMLLERNFNPQAKDKEDWTPLKISASRGSVEILKMLLAKLGNNKDMDDINQSLTEAAKKQSGTCIEELLNAGAKLDFDAVLQVSSGTKILRNYFDAFVKFNKVDPREHFFTLTFDYEKITSENRQMEVIEHIVNAKTHIREELILHPLIASLIFFKWNKIRSLYCAFVVFYFVLTSILTGLTVASVVLGNGTQIEQQVDQVTNSSTVNPQIDFEANTSLLHVCRCLLPVCYIFFFAQIMIKMFCAVKKKCSNCSKPSDWSVCLSCVTRHIRPRNRRNSTSLPRSNNDISPENPLVRIANWNLFLTSIKTYLLKLNWETVAEFISFILSIVFLWIVLESRILSFLAIVLLLRWTRLTFMCGTVFKTLRTYSFMFHVVTKRFVLFLFAFIPLLVGFAVGFYIVFNKSRAVQDAGIIVLIINTMINALDYEEFFYRDNKAVTLPGTAHVIYATFLLLICLVLLNLFIALAVNDTKNLKKKGRAYQLYRQAIVVIAFDFVLSTFLCNTWMKIDEKVKVRKDRQLKKNPTTIWQTIGQVNLESNVEDSQNGNLRLPKDIFEMALAINNTRENNSAIANLHNKENYEDIAPLLERINAFLNRSELEI